MGSRFYLRRKRTMAEVNVNEMLSTFCELVKVPSESPDDQKFIEYLDGIFKKLGGKTAKDSYGNLITKFDAKNSKSTTPIAFAAHADTVKPGIDIEPVIADGKIRPKGKTILAADDKAGITEIITMIRTAEKHPPIEIIITRGEEIGSFGALNLDYSMIKAKTAYVMDMDEPEGVIVGGPTYITLDVDYKGKASHAGMAPEKGISAIYAAAKAVSRLRLGRLDAETTANVGVFQGGEVRNGIPENTKILVECRSLKHEKALALAKEMEDIFKKASDEVGTQVVISQKIPLQAYFLPNDLPVINTAMAALKKHGVDAKTMIIMGGTDATHFNAHGISTAVLGIGARNAHTCEEYAIVDEMVTMSKVIKTIAEDFA